MSAIKVGDKVRWSSADRDDIYEVVLAVTSAHAFVVAIGESTVHRVPLSDLTLVESAPAAPASDAKAAEAERDAARAEVERLHVHVRQVQGRVREADPEPLHLHPHHWKGNEAMSEQVTKEALALLEPKP